MPQTRKVAAALVAIAMLGSAPVMAQPTWNSSTYDREAFWRDAPGDTRQRVEFLQQRIDRGVRDGSLTRAESRDLNYRLDNIRRDARRGYINPSRRDNLQARMDDLSRQIRWQRRDGDNRFGNRDGVRDDRFGNRDGVRDDRFATSYDASRYYRDDARYSERQLTYQDEVYRGSDGRYYCKRNDGTTGLIIGAVGGGVLGNVIDGGHNRVGGTLIGGALGALLGREVDRSSSNNSGNSNSDVRCR